MTAWFKRMLVAALALALVMGCAARADGLTPWTLTEVKTGESADFDFNGAWETMTFETDLDQWGSGSFTLTVGDSSVTQDGVETLEKTVYMLPLGYAGYSVTSGAGYGTLFMVPEYGPSDDPLSYCYLYVDGELRDVGYIPAVPSNMAVDPQGIIDTYVRADMVGTWSRPAKYMLARGYNNDEADFQIYYHLVEVPMDIYPFGMILSLKADLPLYDSRDDDAPSGMLLAADNPQVILAATDDKRWLYVTSMDGGIGGWARMGREDWQTVLYIDGQAVNIDDVFGNILYAD